MIVIDIPKELPIGGRTARVVINPNFLADEGLGGCYYDRETLIEIGGHNKGEFGASVFLHEYIEAVNRIWLNRALGENEVNTIGEALLQLFKSLGIELVLPT